MVMGDRQAFRLGGESMAGRNRAPGLAVLAALALALGAPGVAPGQYEQEQCTDACTTELDACRGASFRTII